jgi:hypothetical protein
MVKSAAHGVFISYSRADSTVVTLAARLLRAGGAIVFQDVVDIEFGAKWQEVLMTAISKCERVLVFWSAAAAASQWVEHEWRTALAAGKSIVPMLLDKTPLPSELAVFNAMPDLMTVLRYSVDGPTIAASPSPMSYKAAGKPVLWALTVAVLLVVGLLALVVFFRPLSSNPAGPTGPSPRTPVSELLTIGASAAVVGVAIMVVAMMKRRRKKKPGLSEQLGIDDELGLNAGSSYDPVGAAKYEREQVLGKALADKLFSDEYAWVK